MDASESNHQQHNSSGNIEQPPTSLESTAPTVHNATRSNHSANKESKWPHRVETVRAALLVLITGTYTYYAGKQVTAMQQQLQQIKTTSDQAKIDNTNSITAQKEIAQNALTASQQSVGKSLGATIDNFHLDQRAWVGMVGTKLDAVEIDKPIYAHVALFNSGKTVAKHVIVAFHMRFSPSELGKLPPVDKVAPKSVGILVPSARYDSRFTDPRIKPNKADKELIEGDWYTYIWGEVAYV